MKKKLFCKSVSPNLNYGLAGWIRTTWLPYLERVPAEKRDQFITELTTDYLKQHALDANGKAHVAMMRIEVAAEKP